MRRRFLCDGLLWCNQCDGLRGNTKQKKTTTTETAELTRRNVTTRLLCSSFLFKRLESSLAQLSKAKSFDRVFIDLQKRCSSSGEALQPGCKPNIICKALWLMFEISVHEQLLRCPKRECSLREYQTQLVLEVRSSHRLREAQVILLKSGRGCRRRNRRVHSDTLPY